MWIWICSLAPCAKHAGTARRTTPAKSDPQYCTELMPSLTRMLLVLPECSALLTSAENGCMVYKLAGKTVILWGGFFPDFPIACNVAFVHQRQAYRVGYCYSFLTGGLVALMLQQITMLGCAQAFLLRRGCDPRVKSRRYGVIFMHGYL